MRKGKVRIVLFSVNTTHNGGKGQVFFSFFCAQQRSQRPFFPLSFRRRRRRRRRRDLFRSDCGLVDVDRDLAPVFFVFEKRQKKTVEREIKIKEFFFFFFFWLDDLEDGEKKR